MEQMDPDPFMNDMNAYGLPWKTIELEDKSDLFTQ
jgi:saccharopine dehydrogenase (NAD+, L-lysine-forming)